MARPTPCGAARPSSFAATRRVVRRGPAPARLSAVRAPSLLTFAELDYAGAVLLKAKCNEHHFRSARKYGLGARGASADAVVDRVRPQLAVVVACQAARLALEALMAQADLRWPKSSDEASASPLSRAVDEASPRRTIGRSDAATGSRTGRGVAATGFSGRGVAAASYQEDPRRRIRKIRVVVASGTSASSHQENPRRRPRPRDPAAERNEYCPPGREP